MRSDSLEAMLNAYKDELTQVNYTPEYADLQRRRKKAIIGKKKKKKLADEALLKKLDGFSAPEETAPTKKEGARKR